MYHILPEYTRALEGTPPKAHIWCEKTPSQTCAFFSRCEGEGSHSGAAERPAGSMHSQLSRRWSTAAGDSLPWNHRSLPQAHCCGFNPSFNAFCLFVQKTAPNSSQMQQFLLFLPFRGTSGVSLSACSLSWKLKLNRAHEERSGEKPSLGCAKFSSWWPHFSKADKGARSSALMMHACRCMLTFTDVCFKAVLCAWITYQFVTKETDSSHFDPGGRWRFRKLVRL